MDDCIYFGKYPGVHLFVWGKGETATAPIAAVVTFAIKIFVTILGKIQDMMLKFMRVQKIQVNRNGEENKMNNNNEVEKENDWDPNVELHIHQIYDNSRHGKYQEKEATNAVESEEFGSPAMEDLPNAQGEETKDFAEYQGFDYSQFGDLHNIPI